LLRGRQKVVSAFLEDETVDGKRETRASNDFYNQEKAFQAAKNRKSPYPTIVSMIKYGDEL
jgi:hypothetical protein